MMPKAAMTAASSIGQRWSRAPQASIAIIQFHKASRKICILGCESTDTVKLGNKSAKEVDVCASRE